MTSAEEIFKSALEELAKEGNKNAKFALSMGNKVAVDYTQVRTEVVYSLQQANESLLRALAHNDVQWTRQTDRAINEALTRIMQAVAVMTK